MVEVVRHGRPDPLVEDVVPSSGVRTGLDVNLQREADNAVKSMLRQYGNDYKVKQAGVVVLDLDGAVRAMVGGRDYGQSQFNRATDALRQPGSSFKPYVYATALSNGYKPTSIVVDAPICLGNWCPQNYSPRLLRLDDADPGDHALDQRHSGAPLGRARRRQSRRSAAPRSSRRRNAWASARRCRIHPRCRSAPPR